MYKIVFSTIALLALTVHAQTPPPEESVDPVASEAKDNETTPPKANEAPEPERDRDIKPEFNPRLENGQESQTEKASPEPGEPIFDWSKHKGETTVHHPNAAKGLVKITRDRDYIYKMDQKPATGAMSFQFGSYNPTSLQNPEETGNRGAKFTDNYQDTGSAPAILITREWFLFTTPIGKLGAKIGSGLYVAQGHGHFVSQTTATKYKAGPKEVFTFTALPNSAGAIYHLKFWDRQPIVPYGEGGGLLFAMAELRDDGKMPKFGGAPAAYAAGGVAFDLTAFDYLTRAQLYREYGVTNIYLTVEYRQVFALSRYDMSAPYINAGFTMDY